jgi:TolB-like protein/tetratricopeptide (TPR) repeat protein/class 3 adenylate cyclase
VATLPTPQVPQPDLQLEIAHLLLIDIVGYSKLLVNEQIESVQELGRIVRSTECFRNAEENGKLIRVPTGDGMALLFFRSPEEPMRCALEISQKLKENSNLRLRMGIHSGPVNQVRDVNDTVNVAGPGINVAQRVMDCGDAGHILLSKHVGDDLAQYRHWQPYLRDLGECEVKHGLRLHIVNLYKDGLGNPALPETLKRRKRWKQNTDGTVRPVSVPHWSKSVLITAVVLSAVALAIALSIYFGYGRLTRSGAAAAIVPEKSIAVLPFENRSEEKANAYFADGIQDEILTRLSKIADLKVISRTSTQHYKSAPENLRDIARQLGVAHILEGSVQKSGDAVRVNVQLIKAANDSHLWADTFDRKLTDIFSVESDVAKAIADQLRAHLTGQEDQVITAKPTENPEAYDSYLRGLAYTLKAGGVTPANSLGAQKYLREAVRLDPKFALGWALLSVVDSRGYITAALQPTVALGAEARQAAETALTLQPNLGEALYAKGYYHYACPKDYDTAVRYFEQARQLLPNGSRIPESLGYVARRRGEWDRSESYFNEAERLDPRNINLLRQHAASYVALRRFPEALRKLDQVLNITPDDVDTLAQKAGIAQAEGDLPRASALLAPLHPGADDPLVLAAQAYQAILEHRPAQIIPRLKEILAKPDPALGYFNGELRFWLAWAQELAGDQAAAQESWRQARNELESFLKEQPENFALIGFLALTNIGLGDKTAALALAERAMAALPIEKDALLGPHPIEIFARVVAQIGEHDRAIGALQKLLSIPYAGPLPENVPLTPALLRLDPMFDPLRNDPRFQKLVASPAPK